MRDLSAIRLRILELSLLQSDPLVGQIEVHESYFGGTECPRKTLPWRQRKNDSIWLVKTW